MWECHVTTSRKKVDTRMEDPTNNLEALACDLCPSLTSQTQPLLQKGKGLVNCAHKPYPSRVQLAG